MRMPQSLPHPSSIQMLTCISWMSKYHSAEFFLALFQVWGDRAQREDLCHFAYRILQLPKHIHNCISGGSSQCQVFHFHAQPLMTDWSLWKLSQPPSLTFHYRLSLSVCLQGQRSYAEMFKKLAWEVWGCWRRKREDAYMPASLPATHSTCPSSLQEKKPFWLNVDSVRAMNIQQPPNRRDGSTMKFQVEY